MAFYKIAHGIMTSSTLAVSNSEMSFDKLLEMFKNGEQISQMSGSDRMLVTLFVAALGMGVTFTVLMFLWFSISVFAKLLGGVVKTNKKEKVTKIIAAVQNENKDEEDEEDEELIVVIAAVIAASMNTSIHNIVVKNIVKVNDHSPSWAKTGRIEQMNTRF